jgi:hypothetical protein
MHYRYSQQSHNLFSFTHLTHLTLLHKLVHHTNDPTRPTPNLHIKPSHKPTPSHQLQPFQLFNFFTPSLIQEMLRRVDDINNIRYHIYEEASVQCPTTNENEKVTETNSSQNEALLLAFHSSLICFKIALCILL